MVITSTNAAHMTCSWKLSTCLVCGGVFHSRRNQSHKAQRKWQPGSETKVMGLRAMKPVALLAQDSINLCMTECQKGRDGSWRRAHLSHSIIGTISGILPSSQNRRKWMESSFPVLGERSGISGRGWVRNPSASLLARKFEKPVSRRALLTRLLGSAHCLMIKCGLECCHRRATWEMS